MRFLRWTLCIQVSRKNHTYLSFRPDNATMVNEYINPRYTTVTEKKKILFYIDYITNY